MHARISQALFVMKTTKNETKTTVIIGGNGKTGRRVKERLQNKNLKVRAVSRSSEIPFDWYNSSTWAPAIKDAQSIYLTYHPDLSVPGAAEQIKQLTDLAITEGVQRIVLLSGRGEPQVQPAEDAIKQSGLEYTILQCSFFAQNFLEGVLAPVEGKIYFPAGDVKEPFIDCNDIADAVVAALLTDNYIGKTYELTGPRSISYHEVANILSEVMGQQIQYIPVSFEQYAEILRPHMPPEFVDHLIDLFKWVTDGHNSHTTNDIQQLIGRKATDFKDYATSAINGEIS